MEPTNNQQAPNATILLMRRMVAEKRETQRQMRESFKTDPEMQRIIKELDRKRAEKHASTL